MKILFISDIHGNKKSLEALRNIRFDQLVVLGDIYSYGYGAEKDEDTIKELLNYKDKMICLKGNSDINNEALFSPSKSIQFNVDGITFRCDHGDLYNYHNASFIDEKGVLMYGHEHVPSINKVGDMIYVCVGSLGKPRKESKPSYAIYEKHTITLYTINHQIIDSIKIKKMS